MDAPSNLNEEELKEKYAGLTDFELKQEYQTIMKIPNARTDINALTSMSVLIPEFESRGLDLPRQASEVRTLEQEEAKGINYSSLGLGILLVVGAVLVMIFTGRLFYVALIGGIIMIVRSFF